MGKIKKLALYMVISLLVACGGDTGFVGDGEPRNAEEVDPDAPVVARVTLLAASTQLQSGDDSGVQIMAIVRDANNILLADQTVEFGVAQGSDGAITVTQLTTDDAGTATAVLTTGGNEQNRTITVNATSSDVSDTLDVSVVGTALTVTGTSSMVSGDDATLTLSLRDSFGDGLAGETFTVTSSNSNTLSAATLTADGSGQAQVDITAITAGADTVTVTALGETETHTITVSSDVFDLDTASGDIDLTLNSAHTINLTWQDGATPGSGTVLLSSTRGTLNVSSLNVTGGADSFTITSANAGPALITATADDVSTTLNIEFVATTPAMIELQSDLSTIGVGGEQATLTATVFDALENGNRVKNQRVTFNIVQDTGGGTISVGEGITDSQGQVSTVFTSGGSPSSKDGVIVSATVANTAVTDQVSLTVGQRALFIDLGTGNSIEESNDVQYSKEYSVLVTDASGGPVANQEVTLSVLPVKFFKGWYEWGGEFWYPDYTIDATSECVNEDLDSDGILGPTEDVNGNGKLDPGNAATVVPGKVTTDESGFAQFAVEYQQDKASWVEVRLEARATVGGTESIDSVQFILSGAASDFSDEAVAPPGVAASRVTALGPPPTTEGEIGSPYGLGNDVTGDDNCFSPN